MTYNTSSKKELATNLKNSDIPKENTNNGIGQKKAMTKKRWIKWLGSTILLGVTLTLIFSLLGRLTIVKQMKEKILKTFGNDIYKR